MTPNEAHALAQATIAELPELVRERLVGVGLCLLPTARPWLLALGVEPDWFGAYIEEGIHDDEEDPPAGAIFLFLDRLSNPETLRRVLLHEIAHACGLDEDEVAGVGLRVPCA